MPRTYGASSLASGRPLPCDQRTITGISPPWRWPARQMAAASGLALKVPEQKMPFACSTRCPGGAFIRAARRSMASSGSSMLRP